GAPAVRRERQERERITPVGRLGARPVHAVAGDELGLLRPAPEGADGRRGGEGVRLSAFGRLAGSRGLRATRLPLPGQRHSARSGDCREAVSELWGIARFKIREGKLEEFKRLSAQAMEIVRTKDTGTLRYDTYFNDDQSECVVLERYRDSEAAIEHASNLGDLFGAVLA